MYAIKDYFAPLLRYVQANGAVRSVNNDHPRAQCSVESRTHDLLVSFPAPQSRLWLTVSLSLASYPGALNVNAPGYEVTLSLNLIVGLGTRL